MSTINVETKDVPAPPQNRERSKIYMRAPGELITGVIEHAIGTTRLGKVLVAHTEHGICAILFGENVIELIANLSRNFPKAVLRSADAAISPVVRKVVEFIEAPFSPLDAPLDMGGTLFQQQVWQALREIPSGQTASYSDIASKIGRPGSVRAVANACAANTIAVAIPCHRAVRADGKISGYRWGIDRKERLLQMETDA